MSIPNVLLPSTESDFDAVLIGHPDPHKEITVDICIRRKSISMDKVLELQGLIFDHPKVRKYLSRKQLDEKFGAAEEDILAVTTYLDDCEISVSEVNTLTRTLKVKGRIVAFAAAFNIQLNLYEIVGQSQFVGYKGMLSIPRELFGIIQDIKGLVYQVKKEYKRPHKLVNRETKIDIFKQEGYTAVQVAKAYDFPMKTKGKGQTIAIIELGGGANNSDFDKYFRKYKIKEPVIRQVGTPSNLKGFIDNSEVTLDTEVLGSIVPGATLVIYFAHDIIDAMKAIISEKKYSPDIVSISWAGNESNYDAYEVTEMTTLFYEASLLGMTIVAASGDHGAFNGGNELNIPLPASNPFVLACGGTILHIKEGKIESEVAWNEFNGDLATGGGFSRYFPIPPYQYEAIWRYPFLKMYSRGVPDVSANASMIHGYETVFAGREVIIGGTSGATPLWAGLIAQMNSKLGYNMGFSNNVLYQLAGTESFRPVTNGHNQYFYASEYWSPCCGLGSPNGNKIIEMVKSLEP